MDNNRINNFLIELTYKPVLIRGAGLWISSQKYQYKYPSKWIKEKNPVLSTIDDEDVNK